MTQFISCDWGTSRLRLRLIELTQRRILAEHATDEGIQHLAQIHPAQHGRREFLAAVLERGIAALGVVGQPDIPVVISGMASSTLGWQALPYASLPAPVDGSTLQFVDFVQAGRRVRLVSGLRAASDVMRGEETELIGLLADPARHHLRENCTVVLPGSHSKHVRLRAGMIVEFATYLTGELYGLLSQNSTLATPDEVIFDEAAFVAGVRTTRSLSMSAALFQTRARTLLGHVAAEHSRAFLSGVLIGAEVATLNGASAGQIVLAAADSFARQYALALGELSPDAVVVQISPADLATAIVMGQATILSLP
ncbi:MAG: 2-dehydro-3-deoxygalactonokinase [Opitutaceae bacterium]|nr:2-dehydro-3-deoxygalactonokinase [Opitutaceae bacterium]